MGKEVLVTFFFIILQLMFSNNLHNIEQFSLSFFTFLYGNHMVHTHVFITFFNTFTHVFLHFLHHFVFKMTINIRENELLKIKK